MLARRIPTQTIAVDVRQVTGVIVDVMIDFQLTLYDVQTASQPCSTRACNNPMSSCSMTTSCCLTADVVLFLTGARRSIIPFLYNYRLSCSDLQVSTHDWQQTSAVGYDYLVAPAIIRNNSNMALVVAARTWNDSDLPSGVSHVCRFVVHIPPSTDASKVISRIFSGFLTILPGN